MPGRAAAGWWATLAIVALAGCGGGTHWHRVAAADLDVTQGAVAAHGASEMVTRSPALRAVARDAGDHATWARLTFRLLGPSDGRGALGSGRVRRQIGLKLLAADPCNLLYVMWRATPAPALAIQLKRNPGERSSAGCGNRGYRDLLTTGAPALVAGEQHVLEAHLDRIPGGRRLAVFLDGRPHGRPLTLPATAAALAGPAGVRSDDGAFRFALATQHRSQALDSRP